TDDFLAPIDAVAGGRRGVARGADLGVRQRDRVLRAPKLIDGFVGRRPEPEHDLFYSAITAAKPSETHVPASATAGPLRAGPTAPTSARPSSASSAIDRRGARPKPTAAVAAGPAHSRVTRVPRIISGEMGSLCMRAMPTRAAMPSSP